MTNPKFFSLGILVLFLGLNLSHSIDFPKISLPSLPNVSLPKIPTPSIPNLPKVSTPFDKGEKCYGSFGCFKTFPASNIFQKVIEVAGIGLYPASPEDIDVTYFVYTCSNRFRPFVLNWNSTEEDIRSAPFDPNKHTVFIVHGFTDEYKEMNWMGDLKDYLLSIKNRHDLIEGSCRHNVIGVDWSEGAKTAFYPQAVANTQLVGAIVAKFIKDLISVHRTTPGRFTIVGHSLGAHTSGFVGTHFKKPNQIKLIIGLDPAGPGFHDVPNTHRLDPSDGKLVLTLHTNGGKIIGDSFGIKESLGHYSFWPNGGSDQPGCEVTRGISNILLEGLFTGLSNTIACSHRRATILVQFNESLLTTAQSMAYTCEDYEKFGEGQCGNCLANPNGCKPFGSWFDFWHQYQLPSNWSKPVNYFIDTTDSKPYTTYHHQMVVRTKPSFSSFPGYIKVTPIGEKRDAEQIKIDPGRVKPNSTYTYLIKVPKSLGNIDKALVRIKNDGIANSLVKAVGFQGESFNPMQVIEEIRFNFMSNEDLATRESKSSTLVPTNRTEVYRIRKIGYVFEPRMPRK